MTPPMTPPTRAPVFEPSLVVVVDMLCETKGFVCIIKYKDDQVLDINVASASDFAEASIKVLSLPTTCCKLYVMISLQIVHGCTVLHKETASATNIPSVLRLIMLHRRAGNGV